MAQQEFCHACGTGRTTAGESPGWTRDIDGVVCPSCSIPVLNVPLRQVSLKDNTPPHILTVLYHDRREEYLVRVEAEGVPPLLRDLDGDPARSSDVGFTAPTKIPIWVRDRIRKVWQSKDRIVMVRG